MTTGPPEVVAVLPAAGTGSRLGHNGAKELVRIGPHEGEHRPVIEWALRRAQAAGVSRAVVVTTEHKHDLRRGLEQLRSGPQGPTLDVLATAPTPSSVHTLGVALERDPDAHWLLIYPDILTAPASAPSQLARHALGTEADVTLALFPSDRPDKVDMVEVDERGRLRGLRIKQPDVGLRFTWAYACWRPSFTALIRRELQNPIHGYPVGRELYFGDLLGRALEQGMSVDTVAFDDGFALDIGTPDDLRRALREPDPRFFSTSAG